MKYTVNIRQITARNIAGFMGGKEMDNQIEALIEVLKKQMAIIEQQANDLKCCGNCKDYAPRGICRSTQGYSPGHYCEFWYSDGLTRIERGYK